MNPEASLSNYSLTAERPSHALELTQAAHAVMKNVPVLFLIGSDLQPSLAFQIKAILISLIPPILNAALFALAPSLAASGKGWGWLIYSSGVVYFLLQSVRFLFSRFVSGVPFIDGILLQRNDRERIAHTIAVAGGRLLQLSISVSGAVIFVGVVWAMDPTLNQRVATYIAVALIIFIGMSGGYWTIIAVILLAILRHVEAVAIRRLDPFRTPAFLEINNSYNAAAALTTVSFVLAEIPALAVLAQAHKSPAAVTLNVLGPLVALSFVIPITALPRSYLGSIIAREKARTLKIIITGQSIKGIYGSAELADVLHDLDVPERMQLYSLVGSMPESTYTRGTVIQLILGVAAIIIPYAVQAARYITG